VRLRKFLLEKRLKSSDCSLNLQLGDKLGLKPKKVILKITKHLNKA